MRFHRGLAALTLGTVAVLGLTACSGDQTAPAPDDGATSAAPTPAVAEGEVTGMTGESFAQRPVAALVAAETMTMDMQMSTQGQSIEMAGPVRMTKTSMDMAVTSSMMGMSFDMILVGGQVFMGMDGQFQEVSPEELGADSVEDLMAQTDARTQIESLQGAVKTVEPVGEETVEGIATTHYLVTVDPSKLDGADPAVVAAMGDSFGYDYWLDDQDRTVRMSYSVEGTDVSIGYTDFGKDVEIAAPDPSQLVTGLF